MHKISLTFVLAICIFSLSTIYAYPNTYIDNKSLLNTLKQIHIFESQFNFDFNSAFYSKLKKENNTSKLINQVKYQLLALENIAKDLRDDLDNANLSEEYKQNALLLLLGLDYYKTAYQELQQYISDDNIKNNFDTLSRISTQYIAGFNTFNWASQWIKN